VSIREISEDKRAEEQLRVSNLQMRDFASRVDAAREEERKRLAREIHDQLGQALTVLKLDLAWVQSKTPKTEGKLKTKMADMIRQVDEAIQRVREIASNLRPSVLDDLGLLPAIEWQLNELKKRTGIRCRLSSNVEKLELDPERSAAVFRVVQEALTNIVRHAEASRIQVRLHTNDDSLTVTVADNGRGLSTAAIANSGSLGILGMKERMARVGGQFAIHSGSPSGTVVEMKVPND
jgi:signal transduction histidine kinase